MNSAYLKVSTGFRLILWAVILAIVAFFVAIIGMCVLWSGMVAAVQGGPGAGGGGGAGMPPAFRNLGMGATVLGIILAVLMVTSTVLSIAGRVMCLATPREAASARGLIFVSTGLEIASLILTILNYTNIFGGFFLPPRMIMVCSFLPMLLTPVAMLLFLLYCNSLAKFVQRYDLAKKAQTVLWLMVAAIGCYVVAFVLVYLTVGIAAFGAGPGGAPPNAAGGAMASMCGSGILMIISLLLILIAIIIYCMMLTGMIEAMKDAAAGRRSRRRGSRYGDDDEDRDDYDDERRHSRDDEEDDDRPRRSRGRSRDDDDDDRPRRRSRDDDDDDDDDRGDDRFRRRR